MSEAIKLFPILVIGLFFGITQTVAASECAGKVFTHELFNKEKNVVKPTISEIEMCIPGVLVLNSEVAISEIVTNRTDAITISPVNNFKVVVHPVAETETVLSFFSGDQEEFIILKSSDKFDRGVRHTDSRTISEKTEAVIFPVAINSTNIESEDLDTGDYVDLVIVSEQAFESETKSSRPEKILSGVEILSIFPPQGNNAMTAEIVGHSNAYSWVNLNVPSNLFLKLREFKSGEKIILLESEKNSDKSNVGGSLKASDSLWVARGSKADVSYENYYGDIVRASKEFSRNTETLSIEEQYITVFRGPNKTRLKCNPECSEFSEK